MQFFVCWSLCESFLAPDLRSRWPATDCLRAFGPKSVKKGRKMDFRLIGELGEKWLKMGLWGHLCHFSAIFLPISPSFSAIFCAILRPFLPDFGPKARRQSVVGQWDLNSPDLIPPDQWAAWMFLGIHTNHMRKRSWMTEALRPWGSLVDSSLLPFFSKSLPSVPKLRCVLAQAFFSCGASAISLKSRVFQRSLA